MSFDHVVIFVADADRSLAFYRDGPGAQPISIGTVMLSFMVDLADVLPRLEAAGGSDVRRATLNNGVDVATLRDPDGTLVELLDDPSRA